jgi:hypothetical protein
MYHATTKNPGIGTVYSYTAPWDAEKIYGCDCDEHYHGTDCSLRRCPTGDDPLTGVGVSTSSNPNQFNAKQKVTCVAAGGTFTLTFKGYTTSPIPYNAGPTLLQAKIEELPTIGAGGITLNMFSTQACRDSGTSWTVEFNQVFGDVPLLIGDKTELFFQSKNVEVQFIVVVQTLGTKENEECSNRGICDSSFGVCTCATYFSTSDGYNNPGQRGDCGYTAAIIQNCPGTFSCSAHGVCRGNPTYSCQCSDGWTGGDCSLRCVYHLLVFLLPYHLFIY